MDSESSSTSTRTITRAWRREARPVWPFVWGGLLPVLLLLGVGLWAVTRFASSWIESSVRAQVASALQAAGDGWVHLAVSGQQVVLSGDAPSDGAGDRAIAVATKAECPTWLGPMPCAISVEGHFNSAAKPTWPAVRASVEGGVLQVGGTLPDEAARGRFEAQAHAMVDPPQITAVKTEWKVSGHVAPPGWEALGVRVLSVASRCVSGWAELRDEAFAADCTVGPAVLAAVEADAHAPTPVGRVGEVSLRAAVAERSATVAAVEVCEAGLAKLLEGTRIEFATASAVLLPSGAPLISRIAKVATDCPGTLRIEGHTDAIGSLESNTALSRQRAEAVRAALVKVGIVPARLVAEGFGPTKPLGSNETPEGRARNRRIEIHVVRPEEKRP